MDGDRVNEKRREHRSRTAPGLIALVVVSAGMIAASPDGPPPAGSIRGRVGVAGSVVFAGTAPAGKPVDMGGDVYCTNANVGKQVLARSVVTDSQGRLANVIIYVRGASGEAPPAPKDAVLLDQQNCFYTPHVVALRVGQPLIIRNSDATLHNVHVHAKTNREFNVGQPIKGLEKRQVFTKAEMGIHVACDIHGWMSGVIAIFDHPWFAVSGDDGSFRIDALPAGDYVLEAWHETLGTREQRVSVGAGATTDVTFTFEGT